MKIFSTKGKPYEAFVTRSAIVLWREAVTTGERREWERGAVIRVVFLPRHEGETVRCTCPAFHFRRGPEDACPHALPAVRAVRVLAEGDSEGVQGLALAGNRVSDFPPAVRGEVTGCLPFPHAFSVRQNLAFNSEASPVPSFASSKAEPSDTVFDFTGLVGGGLEEAL